ncbi:MAG: glutamate-1-semialdehyde 2,1-aminomutase, partial [Bacteroidia bacterium]|nr:glutamate-1-semialdehyde 2,1-aminomutase [Bacteroidia bacterium]
AALMGKRDIMKIGGIKDEGAERVFLISTTHGAEMCGLGALVETIKVYEELDVVGHLWSYGKKLMSGMNQIASEMGIGEYFFIEGVPVSPNYGCKDSKKQISLGLRTLFSQEMIKHGVLMPWIAFSYSHGEPELQQTLEATHKALNMFKLALEDGYEKYLQGKVVKPVFRQFN